MADNERKQSSLFPQSNSLQYVNATINFVDTERNVFDAISQDGMRFIEKCQYLSVNPDGSGKIHHPSAGDTAVIKIDSDGACYLEKIYSICAVDTDGVPTRNLGPNSKFMPGDYVRTAKGGSFLALLRNGLTKIGVSPLCQMIFMKLENYTRWVSRNIEIQASGFRFYSVNDKGLNVTRLSIFLQDAMSLTQRNKSSEASDFEFVVKDGALTLMCGPKNEVSGLRINRTIYTFTKDGAVLLYQSDMDDKPTQRISYTPDGSSEHIVYNKSGDYIYRKNIIRNFDPSQDPEVIVNEEVLGEYNLKVEGSIGITASDDVLVNGKNVFNVAELTHSVECVGSLVESQFNG